MSRNSRKRLRVQPSYGFLHPDCGMQPPRGVEPNQQLQFDLQLVNWYPAKQVCGGREKPAAGGWLGGAVVHA
jgi:hypothetical protein